MNEKTRKLARAAILLAICIASQFLKNTSVYITGPIVNLTLILAAVYCGPFWACVISVIAPLTAWVITGSPINTAMPLIVPCIMIGNIILVLFVCWLEKLLGGLKGIAAGCVAGSIVKALFMKLVIVETIIRFMGPKTALPAAALQKASVTMSVVQLWTALIASAVALVLIPILNKALESKEN